jgi:Co/Zn/Cd efflux system component
MSAHAVLDPSARHEEVRRAIVEAVKSGHAVTHLTVQMEAAECAEAEVHL